MVLHPTCTRCKGSQLIPVTQGFGFGKAFAGGVLLGPLGLLAGGIGAHELRSHCQGCGHRFTVGGLEDRAARAPAVPDTWQSELIVYVVGVIGMGLLAAFFWFFVE